MAAHGGEGVLMRLIDCTEVSRAVPPASNETAYLDRCVMVSRFA